MMLLALKLTHFALKQLVEKHGIGSWAPIETEFSTGRSSDAVRKRWHYVLADQVSHLLIYQSPACFTEDCH